MIRAGVKRPPRKKRAPLPFPEIPSASDLQTDVDSTLLNLVRWWKPSTTDAVPPEAFPADMMARLRGYVARGARLVADADGNNALYHLARVGKFAGPDPFELLMSSYSQDELQLGRALEAAMNPMSIQPANVIAKLLVARDPGHAKAQIDRYCYLSTASSQARLDVMEVLIAAGADINRVDGAGRTALGAAVSISSHLGASLLLAHRANPDMLAGQALWDAVRRADREMVRILLLHGADPDIDSMNLRSAIDSATPEIAALCQAASRQKRLLSNPEAAATQSARATLGRLD